MMDVIAQPTSTTPKFSRGELEHTMALWLAANQRAQQTGDWRGNLGPMYTDGASYTWNVGPNEEFVANGRIEIEAWALGWQMEGFEGWRYPYEKILYDDVAGEVVGFWRQVAPVKRPDGTTYEVAGTGGSWFRYAGNHQWCWQRDFFDLGNVVALLGELAAAGQLQPTLKHKLHRIATGSLLPGHVAIRPGASAWHQRLRGKLALARIALLGR